MTELAHKHLPAKAADGFLALLRPALRLEHAEGDDPVVAQLGGLPTLPSESWPVWEGHGPLGHVLTFDCASVAGELPDLGLPDKGRLAFFSFEGTVSSRDLSALPGVRLLHHSARKPMCSHRSPRVWRRSCLSR